MTSASRIQHLKKMDSTTGKYVLYWMQQAQRVEHNPALELAITEANQRGLPVVVVFGITDAYPEANERHYRFMLEGLQEVEHALRKQDLLFVMRIGSPPEVALSIAKDAAILICDVGYLRHQRQWREQVEQKAKCEVVQVESDVIVPTKVVSSKAEYAARTIRPKIRRHLED